MRFSEVIVNRDGVATNEVLIISGDGEFLCNLTPFHVTEVERIVQPGVPPIVKVSFMATLREVDESSQG